MHLTGKSGNLYENIQAFSHFKTIVIMMHSDAKEGVESGGEEHPNSDMGTQELVKECVLRVTVQENQPHLIIHSNLIL